MKHLVSYQHEVDRGKLITKAVNLILSTSH